VGHGWERTSLTCKQAVERLFVTFLLLLLRRWHTLVCRFTVVWCLCLGRAKFVAVEPPPGIAAVTTGALDDYLLGRLNLSTVA
jgi:hypothetical protein